MEGILHQMGAPFWRSATVRRRASPQGGHPVLLVEYPFQSGGVQPPSDVEYALREDPLSAPGTGRMWRSTPTRRVSLTSVLQALLCTG